MTSIAIHNSGWTQMASSIQEFSRNNRISRAQTYKEIASGRLIARKVGTRTIIIDEDEAAWLRSLPKMRATAVDERPTA
jgi:hypothetical protein